MMKAALIPRVQPPNQTLRTGSTKVPLLPQSAFQCKSPAQRENILTHDVQGCHVRVGYVEEKRNTRMQR